MSLVAFSDLRMATYCPRKLYYARRDPDREPPARVATVRNLATRYPDLLAASDDALEAEPIELEAPVYRARLSRTRDRLSSLETETPGKSPASDQATRTDDQSDRNRWNDLCEPTKTDALVTGRDCRGIVHKILHDPLEPVLVSAGRPPEQGVWKPQRVHAVAAAKALAWEHQRPVGGAWLEYPAYGEIRHVPMTTRRKAEYRRALRTVAEIDGPPPRISNREKCSACAYADTCGVRTRSLRSLLGFG
ncbi:CRISPR-associated protein Cas4 [Natronosalvus vescus]|uniref:CRISPR-associated protein Cas4 n=1 Tax=Natronosalvus vescus TaxID=2953881 RepID=UPI002090C3E3|nr:Dna2/Cas4 domain-containing protein [Natronosalvus vescus]